MRIAGEDELVDAELVVLLDAVGDLLVAVMRRRPSDCDARWTA
jgi:hypothetical protein